MWSNYLWKCSLKYILTQQNRLLVQNLLSVTTETFLCTDLWPLLINFNKILGHKIPIFYPLLLSRPWLAAVHLQLCERWGTAGQVSVHHRNLWRQTTIPPVTHTWEQFENKQHVFALWGIQSIWSTHVCMEKTCKLYMERLGVKPATFSFWGAGFNQNDTFVKHPAFRNVTEKNKKKNSSRSYIFCECAGWILNDWITYNWVVKAKSSKRLAKK